MRLTDKAPAYCSCCFSQKPQSVHVDFECYFDGPVIDPGNGIKQAIDDLVMCEDCIKQAAALLGMIEDPKALETIERLKAELVATRKARVKAERSLEKINNALVAV